ncbi:MAG: sigma-70 family RNA polymerase sigma factor [Planctomycetia bacterium]|nr:sigma-70 family RNA polymerase sigma factor [Planctomycetia bacterium]
MDKNRDIKWEQKAGSVFLDYHQYVRFIAFETAPSRDLVDDITHNVFIYFVENAKRWDYNRDLHPLLKKITKNIALQQWREYSKNLPESLKEISSLLRTEMEENGTAKEDTEQEIKLRGLELCLLKIPEKHRRLIEAFYFHKMKLTEIAASVGMKLKTLQKMMCRIRTTLQNCVERAVQEENSNE